MLKSRQLTQWLRCGLRGTLVLFAVGGCSVNTPSEGGLPPGVSAGGTPGTGGSVATSTGSSTGFVVQPDATTPTDSGTSCVAVSCNPAGGQYCGKIGNACGGTLDCGACTQAGWSCTNNLCVGGASCVPTGICQFGTTKFCGTIGDGCGHQLDCGTCAAGETCTNRVCVKSGCVSLTCDTIYGQYCGSIGDGCGKTLECGACSNGGVCGAGGIDHLCVDPTCVGKGCSTASGAAYCGTIGDGCGRSLACGNCQGDWTCQRNMCVGGPSCTKNTCQNGSTKLCGEFSDNCGGTLTCPTCAADENCRAGVCVKNNCTLITSCQTAGGGQYCGTIGDGCGGTLACGDCAAGFTCGSKVPGVCAPTNCTPITCNPTGGGQYCGRIGDGCGGALDCPATCPNGGVCGSAGVANACPGLPTGVGGCVGLACAVDACTGKPKTTIKGTVYDPGGKLPLYNVMVYVPNAPLENLVEGVSCQKCDTSVGSRPVASALTDSAGNFTMEDAPVGTNIPIVVQTGKWRRQTTLATVKACQANVFTGPDTFRLPRNQSEGHLPKIAMTRGKADSLECALRRIGVDASEFTNPDGNGRVNIYWETGNGTGYDSGVAFPPVANLFNASVIQKYDMVVISCHGESARSRAQPLAEKQIVKDFVDRGGRVFGSHFSFGYFRGVAGTTDAKNFQPSPWPLLAAWDGASDPPFTIETSFPKGVAFADWLVTVGATPTRGTIDMTGVESPAMSLTAGFNSQKWVNSVGGIPYFSVPMPVERASTPLEQCGRFVHTGIHVATSGNSGPFPSSCGTTTLTPQEKAWEFLIFELSACALPDKTPPTAPLVPPPVVQNSPPPPVDVPPGAPPAPPAPPASIDPPPPAPPPPPPPPPLVN